MKATCILSGSDVIFRLSDYDPVYEEAFRMCFYEKDDQGYFKSFPLTYRYTDQVIKRFEGYAMTMFDQLLYRIPVPWEKALELFCRRVQNSGLSWWLTGSCASCIRGIDLNPHDVDVIIDSRHCSLVEDLFSQEIIEPLRDTGGWVTKDFGVLFLEARIDIASDPSPKIDLPEPSDCGPQAMANLETVNWRGYDIRVPPLDLQINVNKRRGRPQRAEKIAAFLEQEKKLQATP
jgi:hypothetical protein